MEDVAFFSNEHWEAITGKERYNFSEVYMKKVSSL
jgi:hypothetical protein